MWKVVNIKSGLLYAVYSDMQGAIDYAISNGIMGKVDIFYDKDFWY